MTLWVPAVVVGPLRVEKLQLVGLTPAFAHSDTLGGVGAYGGIICTLFSDWFGGCGVKLSRSCFTVMGVIFTLGNFGATLGGGPGVYVDDSLGTCCCDWTVACWKFSASWSNACICASPMCAYGASGAGLWRAWISYVAAMVAFSAEDRNAILHVCGRNSTMYGCITSLVSGMYML